MVGLVRKIPSKCGLGMICLLAHEFGLSNHDSIIANLWTLTLGETQMHKQKQEIDFKSSSNINLYSILKKKLLSEISLFCITQSLF